MFWHNSRSFVLGGTHSVGDSPHHLLNPMRLQHLGDVRSVPPSVHGSDSCHGGRAVVIGEEEFQECPTKADTDLVHV